MIHNSSIFLAGFVMASKTKNKSKPSTTTRRAPADDPQPNTPQTHPEVNSEDPDQRLGKIREILFGEQARTQSRELASIAERFTDVETALNERLSTVEQAARSSSISLTQSLQSHRAQYSALLEQFRTANTTFETSVGERLHQVEQQFEAKVQELQTQTSGQLEVILHELRNYRRDISRSLETMRHELKSQMVDRVTLAEMFAHLATRLHLGETPPQT